MQLELLDHDVLGVERPHDLGELGIATREPHRGALWRAGHGLAEAREHVLHVLELRRVLRNRLHARPADLGLELLGRALSDDAPVVDDPHAVRQHVGLLEVLRGEEDGHAAVARQALHLLPERAAALHVEASRGLVEEQDSRAVDERQREVEPPLHAARVAPHTTVRRLYEPDPFQQHVRALACLRPGHPVQGGLKLHVLAAGEERIESCLLKRRPDRGAHLAALLDHVVPGHPCAARGGRQQRGEHVDRGGFAGAVRTQEAVDLAGLHAQVDPVDGARPLLEFANELLSFDGGLGHTPSLSTPGRPPARPSLSSWGPPRSADA